MKDTLILTISNQKFSLSPAEAKFWLSICERLWHSRISR